MKKLFIALMLAIILLSAVVSGRGQVKFLGPARARPIRLSPKYLIPYNDSGFDKPKKRKLRSAEKRGASEKVLEMMATFPNYSFAAPAPFIGIWVDEAWDKARADFGRCFGLSTQGIKPGQVVKSITIRDSIWMEPRVGGHVAGLFDPKPRSIQVVNIYFGTTGDFREARSLLVWEMKNALAFYLNLRYDGVEWWQKGC